MANEFVVTNQAVEINGEVYGYPNNPNGTTIYIPCEQTEIIGSYWRVPQKQGGRLIGYQYVSDNGGTIPPTADAIKVLSVKLTNDAGITNVIFAIANSDNVGTTSPPNQLAYLCNGNGGTLPVMPLVTIPYPILQTAPVNTDSSGTNTFVFAFPANPLGLEYTMNGVYFNGLVPTPAYAPSGITTLAGVISYMNTNWSTSGTFSALSATTIGLSSPTSAGTPVFFAGINVDLTPANYCFNLTAFSTPASVNQVQFGTGTILTVPAFQLTNDPVVLMNVLIKVMSSGTIFNPTSVAHKLGINSTQATPRVLFNGSTVATAAGAVCS